ncbi:MAG TPA: complex I NDUFA9 subunit family protein [Stellaceae bacterium]|nr:complex I NDUFA9 subunit family protein [Stellaceae bacterium]
MRNRRVCVVGGSGFIGRYIVKRLAERGAVVTVVSRHATEARFLNPMGDVGQIALIDAGLGEEAALAAVLTGASAVVSSVGILYERGRQRFPLLHVEGPARLARLAAAAGAKHFVHVSALSADAHAASAYARSKAEGEAAVKTAFSSATILRPSLVFGPEDDFFNRFAGMARLAPGLPLVGGGTTRFQPVYVGDVADAAMAALERPDAAGKTYELGGPAVLSFRALMELMLAEIGRRRLLVPLPYGLASVGAFFMEFLPKPILTRDQVKLLRTDTVVTPGAPGLADLGIAPTALELILPTYLNRFRRSDRMAPRQVL